MVLEHQGLPNFQNAAGLQPALQLYAAAAAAQLSPRNRVPPWAPFLQFGMPGMFGGQFLNRPRFGPTSNGHTNLAALSGLSVLGASGLSTGQVNINNRTSQGPPSEDSNEDRGMSLLFTTLYIHIFSNRIDCVNEPGNLVVLHWHYNSSSTMNLEE